MDIDCPDCGRRVELNQNNIIPYHDNGSPIVCAGSGRQVSAASTNRLHARVAELEESDELARAEEREACAKIADGEAQRARALSERCEDTSDGFAFRGDVATAESIAYAIRARSKGGA